MKYPIWEKTAWIEAWTGEGWQVPLASRKHRGSDPATSDNSVRRES
jgi:hypothetical protein